MEPKYKMTFVSLGKAGCSVIVAVMRKFILLLPLIYIMPALFSQNKTNAVYMAELKGEHFINLNETAPWNAYCAWLFRQAGYAPHVVLECDYTLRASLIASNFGVALTSASARAVDLLKPNRYIRVADPYAVRRMYLYHNPRQYMTQAAQDFLSFCIDYYKPQPETP